MIPQIETKEQLVTLYIAITQVVTDKAWHDAKLWLEWFDAGQLPSKLAYAWNEVWTDEECRRILVEYASLRLGR